MSDKIRSEKTIATYVIRDVTFEVTETVWVRGGASYDVGTPDGFHLHNESFDEIPDRTRVEELIGHIEASGDAEGMHDRTEVDDFLSSLGMSDDSLMERRVREEGR